MRPFLQWRLNSKAFIKQPLGRWNILKCEKALDKRIAMANTDHCGPCSYEEYLDYEKKKEENLKASIS